MALFERPSQHDVFSLFRVGFAARLRWELSDTFITLSPTSELSRTDSRAASAVFFFASNDAIPPSHTRNSSSKLTENPWRSRTMLVAVLARPANSDDTSFLTLSDSVPHLTDSPGLLKVSFPAGTDKPHRTLMALQRPGPGGRYLSLDGHDGKASLKEKFSKRELFHLEILPETIGKGFVKGTFDHKLPALNAVQALSQVVLELGMRFRLRSVHSRVLRKDDGDRELAAIVQNGPKTQIAETSEKELVMTGYRVDGTISGPNAHPTTLFIFKDVESGKALSVGKSNLALSRAKTLCESAAVLVPEGSPLTQLRVQSRNGWGVINLGVLDTRDGEHVGSKPACSWLMAGPKGRLEMRSNPSAWESFAIEFVRQSFAMALSELPRSPLCQVAGEATRAAVRAEIAAKVGKAEGSAAIKSKATKKPVKKGGMDYAAALGGLSDPPKAPAKSSEERKAAGSASGQKAPTEAKNAQNAAGRTAVAAAASASSGLPRNQANRKAAKRNKKKQKAKNAKRKVPAASGAGSQSSAASGNGTLTNKGETVASTAEKGENSDKVSTAGPSEATSSASGESSANKSGPPCAACGRAVEGTYTTAMGKNFHPACFCCGKCRRPMSVGAGQFRERGGIPYCQPCYAAHLASRCARCSQPIMDTVITAMEKTWHKDCLTCTICRLPLTQTFWLYADKPNEPRCSRCVTGSEEYVGRGHGSGRMVNLPMFGRNQGPSLPDLGSAAGSASSAPGGRARLMNPVLPRTNRR